MKLGKMLSVGEVVERTTAEPETETASVPAPLAESAPRGSGVTRAAAELPTPVAAHADR